MAEKSMNKEMNSNLLNGILSKIPDLDLKEYIHNFYEKNIPFYLDKYFRPEQEYLEEIVNEINPQLNSIKQNLVKSISNNPGKAMKTTLEDLLFSSRTYKEEFCSKIKEYVEEIAYVAEIAAVEGYKIWEVKSSLPIIGSIAKNLIKTHLNQEDLPSFKKLKRTINDFKQKVYTSLEEATLSSQKNISHEYIQNKYQERMKKLKNYNRVTLEKNYSNGLHVPLNTKESEEFFEKKVHEEYDNAAKEGKANSFDYYEKRKERQTKFINSEYNSLFEKVVCYIGKFFNWLF